MNRSEFEVFLYGATGFTGRLIACELERQGVRFALGGRDRAKLEALRRELASSPPVLAVALDDPAGLQEACSRCSVVLSAAGPFALFGRTVQSAALASGAHFVDVTGEAGYMLETFRRDGEARERGVVLLNAAGFDVVPGELCCVLACRGMKEPRLVELAFASPGARVSRGTARSMVGIVRGGGLCYEEGHWVAEPIGRHRMRVPFPAPLGPSDAFSAPFGEVATVPRATGAHNVRVHVAAGWFGSRVAPAVAGVASRLLRGPAGRLAERWLSGGQDGPSPEERRASRFSILARATGADGSTQFAQVEGRDPYGLTAVTAVHFSRALAREGKGLAGSLTPTQVSSPETLVELLARQGVTTLYPVAGSGGW